MNIIQTLLSVIPSIILCFLVYKLDRVDKEPISLLIMLLSGGFIAYFPLYHIQNAIISVVNHVVNTKVIASSQGAAQSFEKTSVGSYITAILVYALLETALQWILLVAITKNHKAFDCLFDGLVYSIFVSLGFSVSKNLCITWSQGWKAFFIRSLATIPMYLMISVVCGLFYTLWHTYNRVYETEAVLIRQNVIQKHGIRRPSFLFMLSFFVPFIIQSFMSYTLLTQSDFAKITFYVLVAILYIIFFVVIIMFSRRDSETDHFAVSLLIKAHPNIKNEQIRFAYQTLYKDNPQPRDK